MTLPPPTPEQLAQSLSAVGRLIGGIRDDQWAAPTPCAEWTVRDLVNHLVGVNLAFVARLRDQDPPERGADHLGENPSAAYRDSSAAVQAGFEQPGALERTYRGPLGTVSGAEWLHVRITDLLAHGWDLAQATDQPADLPADLAEQVLARSQVMMATMARGDRFAPAQPVADDAPAIDRLAAFLGRPVSGDAPP